MASTAIVSMISPDAKPNDKGIEPIAACTVALGQYAIIENILSFLFSLVFINETSTPNILNIKAPNIKIIPVSPVFKA